MRTARGKSSCFFVGCIGRCVMNLQKQIMVWFLLPKFSQHFILPPLVSRCDRRAVETRNLQGQDHKALMLELTSFPWTCAASLSLSSVVTAEALGELAINSETCREHIRIYRETWFIERNSTKKLRALTDTLGCWVALRHRRMRGEITPSSRCWPCRNKRQERSPWM